MSFIHNIHLSCPIVSKCCTEHGSDTAVLCAKFQNGLTTEQVFLPPWRGPLLVVVDSGWLPCQAWWYWWYGTWNLKSHHEELWHQSEKEINISMTLIARFMGPTWVPSGADRTHVGPMLAPWTLLSGELKHDRFTQIHTMHNFFAHKYKFKYINGRMIQLACFSKSHLSQRKYKHAGWMSELLGLTTLLEHQISYQCKCNNKLYIGIVIFAHVDNTFCSLLLT